ncbi:MAG TPA: tyrosine-type recombinase/integrase, partial [Candidatus Omnitrophota bacterium]|nr:tyrosine-type recombinase/integrase [Candidatus Omnitrophota bacterium]
MDTQTAIEKKPGDRNHFLIGEFLNYLAVEKGLSQNTLDAYRRDLDHYTGFLRREKMPDWEGITRAHILKFLAAEGRRGLEVPSVARALVSVKLFHRFLAHEKYVKEDVTSVLESSRQWKKLPQFLTVQEMDAILKAPDPKTPAGIRDRALLECLYATGMRVSEVTGLSAGNVYLDNHFIKCRGKGNKERIVPLGSVAVDACRAYLARVRSKIKARTDHFFLGRNGSGLTRQYVWQMIKRYAMRAGIAK